MTTRTNTNTNVPATVTETAPVALSDMEQLKLLLAKFDKATVAKLSKEVAEKRHTLLSVSMDAIVTHYASGDLITDNVYQTAKKLAEQHEVEGHASMAQTSVAQLMRHVAAFKAAEKRASEAKPDSEATEDSTEAMPPAGDQNGLSEALNG